MFQPGSDWNPLQTRLKELITKKEHFTEMQKLLLQMHSLVHSKQVYGGISDTFLDEIWEGLSDKAFRMMPTVKDDTVAWNIWHITRIEDLTANYLIAGQEQILDQEWQERLHTKVTDTGNAMTDEEILAFSNEVEKDALYEYRNAVGRRTKDIIEHLNPDRMKQKVSKDGIVRIAEVGGVAAHPDAVWLLDFWGKKTIAGIILMPITRHQVVHLNDSVRLKKRIK